MMIQDIHGELTLAADTSDVFQALTDQTILERWFAEQADIELENRKFGFRGRYTPDGESYSQELMIAAPDNRLVYSWQLFGCKSVVDIHLANPAPDQTIVSIDHLGVPVEHTGLLDNFWSLSLENLRGWLTTGSNDLPRYDFSTIPRGDVHCEIDIDAPAEQVFKALVDPGQLDRYMGYGTRIDPEPGGRYDVGWGENGPQRILDISAPERLSYSWRWEDSGDTVVTWTLDGSGGRTRLTLVHSGFAADRVGTDYSIGWLDYMNKIRAMLESGSTWERPYTNPTPGSTRRADESIYIPSAGVSGSVSPVTPGDDRNRIR